MKVQRFSLNGIWLCIAAVGLLWGPQLAQAKYIGADPPKCATRGCLTCGCPSLLERSNTSSSVSLSEGNLSDWEDISSIRSLTGPTLDLSIIYNSYNADGSRATVDTVMGTGWTHSFNIFLFSQLGSMFRYDANGCVTRYALGSGGSFTAAPGYFETLVKNPDGSFTLTQKDQTVYTFKSIAGTLFLVGGPVWRLTSIVDRNGNTTTLTYTGGNLTTVTDTYGRTLTFAYNTLGHITSVTDPDGRATKFQYDVTGQMLTTVTDPLGNTIHYTYNALYQITSKTDKAGRTFNHVYSSLEPVAVYDSTETGPATLSNSGNWATNATLLAENQVRSYTPATTINTDGRGNIWKYQYDTNGYLLETIAPDGSTTMYTYNPNALEPATITDADGHTTSYTYDSMGNRLTMTDALGRPRRPFYFLSV
jgi:YD repeat-containing protein